jgi:ABC-type glycerol-3-phosphate transport system permease component
MPILSHVSRRSISHRLTVAAIYVILSVLGLTMVVPFMMTVTSSLSNDYDYHEFRPFPKYLYSRPDRFMKGLVGYFNTYAGWTSQLSAYFPTTPTSWTSWLVIGKDSDQSDILSRLYVEASPQERQQGETKAHDYADFAETYPVEDSVTPVDPTLVTDYLEQEFETRWAQAHPNEALRYSSSRRQAAALQLLNDTFHVPFVDFNLVRFDAEMGQPIWQRSWIPPNGPKYQSFLDLKQAYKDLRFTPGVASKWKKFQQRHRAWTGDDTFPPPASGAPERRALWLEFKREVFPASPTVPFAMRVQWREYLQREDVRDLLKLGRTDNFDLARYNAMAGTDFQRWTQIPFPLPADAPAALQQLWSSFVQDHYPIRLVSLVVTPDLTAAYQKYLQDQFKTLPHLNQLLGSSLTKWADLVLSPTLPASSSRQQPIWVSFVKTLPTEDRMLHSSENAFQQFMLARYGTLDAINREWGSHYRHIEEVFPPFDQAYLVTFLHDEWAMTLNPMVTNYRVIASYLLGRSNAVPVTLLLIAMSIFCTLTVNPFAAYALSRFNLRGQEAILLFLLATSAFPAMISAIPGYLLMRDLGLLNTFFALVLPGAASGMSIFILKGFFDSLPPELFEAATIDGAKEWQIFLHVTMPMVKPILAINALGAFLAAYTGWEWALIICQDQRMWTMAVWMYQASVWWTATPWVVNAGFIIVSIPTLIVFLTCQNIILRGIIIPQMK